MGRSSIIAAVAFDYHVPQLMSLICHGFSPDWLGCCKNENPAIADRVKCVFTDWLERRTLQTRQHGRPVGPSPLITACVA